MWRHDGEPTHRAGAELPVLPRRESSALPIHHTLTYILSSNTLIMSFMVFLWTQLALITNPSVPKGTVKVKMMTLNFHISFICDLGWTDHQNPMNIYSDQLCFYYRLINFCCSLSKRTNLKQTLSLWPEVISWRHWLAVKEYTWYWGNIPDMCVKMICSALLNLKWRENGKWNHLPFRKMPLLFIMVYFWCSFNTPKKAM